MSLAGTCILGQAVSGTKVARARFRRRCGTWEPLAAMWPAVVLTGVGGRETPKQRTLRGVEYRCAAGGGPPRSSEEASVVGVEQRGRVVLILFGGQPEFPGGAR